MEPNAKIIKLGVIGASSGNGHPYSWSAIFNGFEPDIMKECAFPTIGEYLSEQTYPDDFLGEYGNVNAIWTQDFMLSTHIAAASRIKRVCQQMEDLVTYSDAILLARDDAENHSDMAKFFLEAGKPIFIDKPFALRKSDAEHMLSHQSYDTQIFTCSALRFAEELKLTEAEKIIIGDIIHIDAFCPKYWETYSVHVIEPILINCLNRGEVVDVFREQANPWHVVSVKWQSLTAKIHMTKNHPHPIEIIFHGNEGKVTKTFSDSFNCFKTSLWSFINQINIKKQLIPREDTLEIVSIIDDGR